MHKQRENGQLFLKALSTLLQYQTHFPYLAGRERCA